MESHISDLTTTAILNELNKWTEWKSKNNSQITLSKTEKNVLYFKVDSKSFTLTCPSDYPNDGSLLMIESNDSISWINKAMNFII